MRQEKTKVQRLHISMTPELLDRVERYQERNAIPNRNVAIMELVRKGLREE